MKKQGKKAIEPHPPTADVEVRLVDDLPVDKDEFGGHQRVAAAIASMVAQEDGGKAIAIEGGWGSGKSTVVQLLRNELKEQAATVVVLDAWSHEGDPLRRVFLERLTSECASCFDEKTKRNWDERKRRQITGTLRETHQVAIPVLSSKWPLLVLAIASAYPLGLVSFGVLSRYAEPWPWWVWTGIGVAVCLSAIPVILFLVLFFVCVFGSAKRLTDAGRLIAFWSKKIDETTTSTTHEQVGPTSIEFQSYFADLIEAYIKETGRKLVIVLDNLDRVPAATARSLWSTLRVFADCCEIDRGGSWSSKVWFVVPYDRDAAATLWDTAGEAGSDDAAEEDSAEGSRVDGVRDRPEPPKIASAFLDKTFQIRFAVPPLHLVDWEQYLKRRIAEAMPGVGTHEQIHRVYRLSERLADTKRRAPSPRHLKLYVNDIGALVRQFKQEFPLDHLALYAILRRQGTDVRLWILSRQHERDILTSVMPDSTYVPSLLALYYGTTDLNRAQSLLLEPEVRRSLREGDGEILRNLSELPAFGTVVEIIFEKILADPPIQPAFAISVARALSDSDGELNSVTASQLPQALPRHLAKMLEAVEWGPLDTNTAEAVGQLLWIIKNETVTLRVLVRLVSDTLAKPEHSTDFTEWARGVLALHATCDDLGHEWRIEFNIESSDVISCLSALDEAEASDGIVCGFKSDDDWTGFTEAVSPDGAWEFEQYNALGVMLRVNPESIDLSQLMKDIAARLQDAEVSDAEGSMLFERLFDCGELADHGSLWEEWFELLGASVQSRLFNIRASSWKSNSDAIAWLLVTAIATEQLSKQPVAAEEQAGHKVYRSIIDAPEKHGEIVNEIVRAVVKYPAAGLASSAISLCAAMGKLAAHVLSNEEVMRTIGDAVEPELIVEKYDDLVACLGRGLDLLLRSVLDSSGFCDGLGKVPIESKDAPTHVALIRAGALKVEAYKTSIHAFLASVDSTLWVGECQNPTNLYQLLVLAVEDGYTRLDRVDDAIEEIAKSLLDIGESESQLSSVPQHWDVIYRAIPRASRQTIANKIVDGMKDVDQVRLLSELFGTELVCAFAASRRDNLVRQVMQPVMMQADIGVLKWLLSVASESQIVWNSAPGADRKTFGRKLRGQLDPAAAISDEAKAVLTELARVLGISVACDESSEESPADSDESEG